MTMPVLTASLLEWALWYASQGHPVFPCHTPTAKKCSCGATDCQSIGKHPRIQEWQKRATTDIGQIEEWWKRWPKANIGLATGVTLWMLDVDPRHGGDQSLHNLENEHGALPETPRSLSGGGGCHVAFALPQDGIIRNTANFAPGLDTRGKGGFVVVPPSHHVSGKQYCWELTAELTDVPLAQAPDWLLKLCVIAPYQRPPVLDAQIPNGERNNTLSRMAYHMRTGGMSLEEILGALRIVNEGRCEPPLDEEELKLIVNGKRDVGPDPVLRTSVKSLQPEKQILAPHETLTELLAADIPPPRQLFHGLMHEGLLLFGGKSKRGKSWLIFDLAIALATGKSAFGEFVCHEATPVLYLALEDGRARLQARAKAIEPTLITANNFHLRYTFPPLNQDGIKLLADEIVRYKYGLVIIDVLAKVEPMKQNKGDKNYHDIYEMFTPLQELRKEQPFCLTMLTHLRKQDADDVFDSLLGSVAYQGAQDVLWVLERKPKDDYAFLYTRDKDAEDKTIALRFNNGRWEYMGEGDEFELSRDQRKVMNVLTEEGGEMSIVQIQKAAEFPESKYGYLRKLLVTMVKEDLIHRTRHGNYSATLQGAKQLTEDDGGIVV